MRVIHEDSMLYINKDQVLEAKGQNPVKVSCFPKKKVQVKQEKNHNNILVHNGEACGKKLVDETLQMLSGVE